MVVVICNHYHNHAWMYSDMQMPLIGRFSQNNSHLMIFASAIINNGHIKTLSPLEVTKLI